MEKLHKRSDGYSETSEGFFAVVPLRKNAVVKRSDGDYNLFDFKPSFQSETIRVEWPVESAIALFPSDVSIILIRLNHARNLTTEEVEQYNASVDFLDGKELEPVDPPKEPPSIDLTKTEEPETPADVQDEEEQEDATGNEEPEDQTEEEKKKPGRPKKSRGNSRPDKLISLRCNLNRKGYSHGKA